jgi:hypothetical protein
MLRTSFRMMLACASLVLVACARHGSDGSPRPTADFTAHSRKPTTASTAQTGAPQANGLGGPFSDIVVADEKSRTALLLCRRTETAPLEYVLVRVDDGQVLERLTMAAAEPRPFQEKEWINRGDSQMAIARFAALVRRLGGSSAPFEPPASHPWRLQLEAANTVVLDTGRGCFAGVPSGGGFVARECRASQEKPPFYVKAQNARTWEIDGSQNVCFFWGSTDGRSRKITCFKSVTNAGPLCNGDVCAVVANSAAGDIVFSLVSRTRGDLLGEGSILAGRLLNLETRGERVALRFGAGQAVIDLKAKRVLVRTTAPVEVPALWFGDDALLSCNANRDSPGGCVPDGPLMRCDSPGDPSDPSRVCESLAIVRLDDANAWRGDDRLIHFKFSAPP